MAALIASAATVLVSVPAQAGHFNGVCEDSEICLYPETSFRGHVADFYSDIPYYPNWTYYGTRDTLNDSASSIINEANILRVRVWEHTGYTGRLLDAIGQNSRKDFLTGYDNTVSSHEFITG